MSHADARADSRLVRSVTARWHSTCRSWLPYDSHASLGARQRDLRLACLSRRIGGIFKGCEPPLGRAIRSRSVPCSDPPLFDLCGHSATSRCAQRVTLGLHSAHDAIVHCMHCLSVQMDDDAPTSLSSVARRPYALPLCLSRMTRSADPAAAGTRATEGRASIYTR
jgi:hypothetical protein